MNGGYGAGRGGRGYGDQDYGDGEQEGSGDRGRSRRGPRQPPRRDRAYGPQGPDQPYGQPQGRDRGYGPPPGSDQSYDQAQGRDRGYGPQGPDQSYDQAQGRDRGYGLQGPNQPYGQAQGRDPGYGQPQGPDQPYGQGRDQGYGPQGAAPDPWAQGPRQPTGAPRYPRGSQQSWPGGAEQQAYGPGPRSAQGGDPAWQAPDGYDPRGTAPRRSSDGYPGEGYPGDGYPGEGYPGEGYQAEGYPSGGYPGDGYQGRDGARVGQGDYPGRAGDPGRDAGFLPGFGSRGDDYAEAGQGTSTRYPGDADDRPGRRGRRGRDDRRGGGGGGGRGGGWDDDGAPRKRRGTVRRLAPWIALVVILTPILIGGLYVYHLYENKYHPADYAGPGTGSVTVQVNSGDTAFSLGPRLQTLGVVASARAFELAAESGTTTTTTTTTTSSGLEAGYYKLHLHMQASLAWAALLNPKNRVQLTVTIPEGKRASQVVAILAKETSIPATDFQKVINNPSQLGLPSYAKGKVEGYLFPATYTIQPNETALQILKSMVQRYDVEAQQINIASAASHVGLTPEQLIIEASMVQAEGGVVSDYPKIARVIINRLNDGMKLQFDSVLLYGLNAYAINVTDQQIATPGPYNDFQNAGLPPTPISNPGDAAIQGVLHPASGDWLYFLTKTGGASEFSATPLAGQ